MEYFICENVFVPLRLGPSHKSEMLSQILFGEKYTITDMAGNWVKIESVFDKFTGWIDTDQIQNTRVADDKPGNVLNKWLLCYKEDKTKMVLEPGCEIYDPDFDSKTFCTGNSKYTAEQEFSKKHIEVNESLAETAIRFINSPYIWGGRIPSGVDCSGLIQLVFKIHGIKLPRLSAMQAEAGKSIDFIDMTEPGDLVFFDDDRGNIAHVGMIISKGLVIHAVGRVRIDIIDHQGIYKQESNTYSFKLRTIKRIL